MDIILLKQWILGLGKTSKTHSVFGLLVFVLIRVLIYNVYDLNIVSVPRAQVQEFQKGDKVRIRDDSAEVKILNCRVGWKDEMEEVG